MTEKRKAQIQALLKGIETGDPDSVLVVNPDKYIQHNPQTREGGEGLAALFKRLSKTSPRVNIVRIFSDGDYVFGHTEYDFSSSRIGFEIFRFEGDMAVEHWDNIQLRAGPNRSARSMVDGQTQVIDLDHTDDNRCIVKSFVEAILINGELDKLSDYIHTDHYLEHNPHSMDGLHSLHSLLSITFPDKGRAIKYQTLHRLLAEGNFVLSVCEGTVNNIQSSFFDLFRIEDGMLVEHWDTTETIPPVSEWKNQNGKF